MFYRLEVEVTLSPIIMVSWKMGAWKMTEDSVIFWGPFSTSMIMGGRVYMMTDHGFLKAILSQVSMVSCCIPLDWNPSSLA